MFLYVKILFQVCMVFLRNFGKGNVKVWDLQIKSGKKATVTRFFCSQFGRCRQKWCYNIV